MASYGGKQVGGTSRSASYSPEGSYLTVSNHPAMHVQGAEVENRLPKGKTSVFGAIFLVVNAALGAGLLAFPLAFYMTGGFVSGILIELVSV